MATYTITLNERTSTSKALMAYLKALGVLVSRVTPKTTPQTRIFDPETGCYLNAKAVKAIEEAHEDMKNGKLKTYDSVDAMFQDLGINV